MRSFEEMRACIHNNKFKCMQKETKYSIRVAIFCTILILCMCITPSVVDAVLMQNINISGKLQYTEATVELLNKMDTWDGSGYRISETLFGREHAMNAVKAMDMRAYTNAVAEEIVAEEQYMLLQEEKRLKEAFFLPDVNLEYSAEGLEMSYDLQKHVYETCLAKDLDYWIVMGMIARESRFDNTVRGYSNGVTYYGLMQMNWDIVEVVREWTGDYTLDPADPYDNVTIGTTYLKYLIEQTGYEQGGVFAYGIGLGGYNAAIAQGIYTDKITTKAYKYRDLLREKERYTATEARELGYVS